MTLTITFSSAPSARDQEASVVLVRESESSAWVRYGPEVVTYSGTTATVTVPTMSAGAQVQVRCGRLSSSVITIAEPAQLTLSSAVFSTMYGNYSATFSYTGNAAGLALLDYAIGTLDISTDGGSTVAATLTYDMTRSGNTLTTTDETFVQTLSSYGTSKIRTRHITDSGWYVTDWCDLATSDPVIDLASSVLSTSASDVTFNLTGNAAGINLVSTDGIVSISTDGGQTEETNVSIPAGAQITKTSSTAIIVGYGDGFYDVLYNYYQQGRATGVPTKICLFFSDSLGTPVGTTYQTLSAV